MSSVCNRIMTGCVCLAAWVGAVSPLGAAGGSHADATASTVRHVVSSGQEPAHVIAQGRGLAQLLLNADTGAKDLAMSLLTLSPGATVPEHVHADSSESLYIQSGAVEMVIGGRHLTARAGDAVYIPAGVKHSARVLGRVLPVQAVQIYVGPGPERRFAVGETVPAER